MVERPAVNRLVVGPNPTLGANKNRAKDSVFIIKYLKKEEPVDQPLITC